MSKLFDKNGKMTPSTMTATALSYANLVKLATKIEDDKYNDEVFALASLLPEYTKQKALELNKYEVALKELSKAFPDDQKLQNELMPLIFGKEEENE